MKISIITWDACFRESFHTIKSFCEQELPVEDFEFIWVDYYINENETLLNTISKYSNAHILNLNNPKTKLWHLGECINEGVKKSSGKVLIIPDGDILVPNNILREIITHHKKTDGLALYFRRWDELKIDHNPKLSYHISHLDQCCRLTNPTNYAGLISLSRTTFNHVQGYEESEIFSGPGVNGLELYTRLRNSGVSIQWSPMKIYHPFHRSSGSSDKYRNSLETAKRKYQWIMPYAGLEQSWVVHNRELDLSYLASKSQVHKYLDLMPSIKPIPWHLNKLHSLIDRRL